MNSSGPAFFRGVWIEPGHAEYDAARGVFNQRVDARPKVIARCAGVADVVSAVKNAREQGLGIDVRSTGYNLGGLTSGNGMVIDLSLMRGIQVIPEQRIARIQGGVRGGDLQIEAGLHGLGAATGALAGTGVGLILGGGVGHLAARAGYASDNVISVEVVTAAGEVVTASAEENPDLFWAVRGAPGSFGVVTALEVRLHEVPPVVHVGVMSWSLDNLGAAIEALRTSWDWASDDVNFLTELGVASLDGRGGLDMFVCHSGSPQQAREDFERLRSFGAPDVEEVIATPYRDLHFLLDDEYPPTRTTINEQPVSDLGDELVDALVSRIRQPAGRGRRFIEVIPRRGALGRAPEFPSALRETAEDPTWMLVAGCWWDDESEDDMHEQWTEDVISTIRQIGPAVDSARPNTVGVTLDLDGVGRLYGDRFQRLRDLKRQWDPDNLFAGKYDIPPAKV